MVREERGPYPRRTALCLPRGQRLTYRLAQNVSELRRLTLGPLAIRESSESLFVLPGTQESVVTILAKG